MQYLSISPRLALAVAAALLASACGGGGNADPADLADGGAEIAADSPPMTDEVPFDTSAAPQSDGRERALAVSTCQVPAYAKPRVGAFDMSRDASAARQALLARFGLAIVNLPYGASDAERNAFSSGAKALNPKLRLAQYINFPDLRDGAAAGSYDAGIAQEASARGWWLRDAAGSRTTWTSGTTYGVNMTSWAPVNGSGQRYPQFKAQYDHTAYFAGVTGFDYAFTANTWAKPRVDADWRRNHTNQLATDPTIQSATRAGYAAYWSALRTLQPGIKLMGGLDGHDLSAAEYKGQLDGALLDGMIGQSWSIEAKSGFAAMIERYRSVVANTSGDKLVAFSVYGASPTDYATMRYGLAASLMNDGHFVFRPKSGSTVSAWYDEYAAPLGVPVDAAPAAPHSSGVWLRRFENGVVLVNPQSASATVDVGSGYQRLAGAQDPAVNNGQVQSSVTLPARSGLVMLKVAAPCDTEFATPKIAAIDYSKDTTDANKAYLAKFKFALIGLNKSKGATAMNAFTSGLKALNPAMKIAQYTIVNEVKCSATSIDDYYDLWLEVNKADWWLRNASGTRSQWTTTYDACDINLTSWNVKNAAGKTWAQYKWDRDWAVIFKNMPAADFVHIDNMLWRYRKDADFRRIGTNQLAADPVYAAAWRAGMMAYVAQVRSLQPQLKVSVNADNDLSYPEYDDKFDMAFLEGVVGKSWSKENKSWDAAMAYYRTALKNVRVPGNTIFQTFSTPTDYALVRYGLASAMLDDGYFMQTNLSGGQLTSWFDEFEAPIGAAAEPPPTAPAQNGIWMRRYENGLVLVNPSKTTSATIFVGAGYRRLQGTQDPAVNNGTAQSTVTLPPRSGLLMLKG